VRGHRRGRAARAGLQVSGGFEHLAVIVTYQAVTNRITLIETRLRGA